MTMTEKRKALEEKFEAQMKEWNAQIALYKAKAKNAGADIKLEYSTAIENLEHKRDKAKAKLHELKAAGNESWGDLKTGVEKSWAEVKTAFHEMTAKFK